MKILVSTELLLKVIETGNEITVVCDSGLEKGSDWLIESVAMRDASIVEFTLKRADGAGGHELVEFAPTFSDLFFF